MALRWGAAPKDLAAPDGVLLDKALFDPWIDHLLEPLKKLRAGRIVLDEWENIKLHSLNLGEALLHVLEQVRRKTLDKTVTRPILQAFKPLLPEAISHYAAAPKTSFSIVMADVLRYGDEENMSQLGFLLLRPSEYTDPDLRNSVFEDQLAGLTHLHDLVERKEHAQQTKERMQYHIDKWIRGLQKDPLRTEEEIKKCVLQFGSDALANEWL